MRYSEERCQWEHTREEEELHGFSMTNAVDMPPSLRDEFDRLREERDAIRDVERKHAKEIERLYSEVERLRGALRAALKPPT